MSNVLSDFNQMMQQGLTLVHSYIVPYQHDVDLFINAFVALWQNMHTIIAQIEAIFLPMRRYLMTKNSHIDINKTILVKYRYTN